MRPQVQSLGTCSALKSFQATPLRDTPGTSELCSEGGQQISSHNATAQPNKDLQSEALNAVSKHVQCFSKVSRPLRSVTGTPVELFTQAKIMLLA